MRSLDAQREIRGAFAQRKDHVKTEQEIKPANILNLDF